MKNPTGSSPCLRRLADARWLLLLLVAFVVATARGVTVTAFDPNTWPRTDAAIGVSGFTIEDFEDTTLVSGLQVQLSGGSNDFGPTSTLPKTWDPNSNADDPNGAKVLATGIWDGTHVLMNRRTAVPGGYVDGEWADTTFSVSGGASSIGFSVQNLESPNTMMTVLTNLGTTSVNLSNVANFTVGGARNGYLRIDAAAGEVIVAVKIDNLGGDGFAFDHLAFSPVPLHATVTAFDPTTWPRTDAAVGVIGFTIEDFDDTTLVPNLQVQLSGGSNDYGPTSTLPRAFDPNADDPNVGKLLVPGIWDGTHVLLNRKTAPLPNNYQDNEWADITFSVTGGTASIGFSLEQISEANTPIIVTTTGGTSGFVLGGVANFTVGDGRNGYVRIDAAAGERILSVKIDNQPLPGGGVNDGIAFDHLAFQPLAPRPIAHWKFDEASGTVARDSAGSFDGTLAGGAQFVSGGVSGNAISLDKTTNSLVNAGTSFPGFLAGDFTIVAWVKTTDTSADTLFVSKHNGGTQNGYFLTTNTTGGGGATGKATFTAGAEFVSQSPTSTTTVTDGQWHQVVGVYRAGGVHSIFVDGSPVEASTASQAIAANTSAFIIGGLGQNSGNGTPAARYTGLIDDVQVYDAALTDAQIDFLFANPGKEFQPATYDITTDWSDAANPNASWTYREGNNALPHVDWWQRTFGGWTTAQPGWADSEDGNDRVPVWFKSVGTETFAPDWVAGDVTVHTNNDPGTTGNGHANVIWTSPGTDTITISGGVWEGRNLGRGNDWFLYKNATLLTQGHIEDGDPFSRANPFLFSTGSGGAAAVASIPVVAGDVIKLEFVKTTTSGDGVGVDLTITGASLVAAPDVTTSAATNVTATSATLNGSVNPNGTITSAYFEYGTTTSYGSTTPVQSLGAGTSAVAISANLTGLTSGATYHVRAVALTSAGTFFGQDATFTVLAPPPTVTTGTATDVRVHRATLNGTLDPNGADTLYYFEYGPDTDYGSVTPTINAGMTAGPVSATITGLDGAATVHFRLVGLRGVTTFPGSDAMFTTLTPGINAVASRGDFAPDAAGAATTATFFSFGPPAIGDAGHLAFRATLTKNVGGTLATTDTGIWFENNAGLRQLAREGGIAPDTTVPFASFGDPVFAAGDRVAFLAKLKTKTNATGIWSNVSGTLRKIARLGDAAPGTTATFGTFVSLGLSEGDGPVFIAKLKGATPATDVGIFAADNAGVVRPVLVREGGQLDAGGGAMKTVATLQFLPPMKVVNGQTRSFNADGDLAFRATFTDKSTAIFKIVGGTPTALAAKGGAAPGLAGATISTLGQPALDGAGGGAFLGTLTVGEGGVTKADDVAIFSQVGQAGAAIVARENDGAAAKFASFSDPVANADGAVAFLARLKAGTANVTTANANAIFTDAGGALALLARQGFPARDKTGQPLADLYAKFTSLALPDAGGPVYLAKLKRSKTVTAKNDTGIWAGNFAGGTALVVRTGDPLTVGAGQRTVKLLQFLPPVRGVPGQTRSFNTDGYLTFRAVFTDRTEAIFRVLR